MLNTFSRKIIFIFCLPFLIINPKLFPQVTRDTLSLTLTQALSIALEKMIVDTDTVRLFIIEKDNDEGLETFSE